MQNKSEQLLTMVNSKRTCKICSVYLVQILSFWNNIDWYYSINYFCDFILKPLEAFTQYRRENKNVNCITLRKNVHRKNRSLQFPVRFNYKSGQYCNKNFNYYKNSPATFFSLTVQGNVDERIAEVLSVNTFISE